MSKLNERVEALFQAAVALETEAQRADYLNRACLDPALRREVESLLAAHDRPDSLFAQDTVRVEAPSPESVGAMIGRYKLLEALGEGGFGTVWLAEQKEPVRRRVALKVIKLGMDTKQVVARFEAERQALALMDHPNIAKVLDAGTTDSGRPYFVMELVRGIPITTFCDENKLMLGERLDLFIKVCHAVQHAHQKGIIHRDLKPSNVLVTLHDGVPVPKVIDFGIAKATQQELTDKTIHTMFQQFIGTPAYVSPEQAEMSGLDVDTRSDIYSLGVLLYELLTGLTPFNAQTLMQSGLDEMRRIIREEEPKRPSTRLSTLGEVEATTLAKHRREKLPALVHMVRGDLDWIVLKCLEKDRSRRYETANGLAADLKRHLNNEPVTARPPSKLYEFQKTVRRHKFGFAATAAIILLLATGVAVSTWQTRVANSAREKALVAESEKEIQRREAVTKAEEAQNERNRAERLELAARRRAYAADMNLAQRALELNDLGNARRLLDRYRPAKNEVDLRGWEWRYLWKQVQTDALDSLPKMDGAILDIAASKDGKWLAVVGQHGSLRNLAAGKELPWPFPRPVNLNPQASVFGSALAFSPTRPLLAFAQSWRSGTNAVPIQLLDLGTGERMPDLQLDGAERCDSIAFTADGERLAAITYEPTRTLFHACCFRVSDGKRLQRFPVEPVFAPPYSKSFALTPDGHQIFVGTTSGRVVAYDLATGQPRWAQTFADDPIVSLAVSSDGRRLAVGPGAGDPRILLVDTTDGSVQKRLKERHRGWIGRLIFLHEDRLLASSSADQTISIWDLDQGDRIRVLRGHQREIWALASLPDSKLVSGSKVGEVMIWDASLKSDERILTTRPFRFVPSTLLHFAPDSKSIFTMHRDTNIVVEWNGEGFANREAIPLGGSAVANAVFEPGGWRLIVGHENGSIEVVDLRTRQREVSENVVTRPAIPLCFNGDRTGVWLRKGDEMIEEWRFGQKTPLRSIVWSFDPGELYNDFFRAVPGSLLVGDGRDRRFQVYDESTGQVLYPHLLDATINGDISPDSHWFALSHEPGAVAVWETKSLKSRSTPFPVAKLSGAIMSYHGLAFTPDSTRLAAASGMSQMVTLWDTASFEPVLTLAGLGWSVNQIAFSPDGNKLACGGRALHIWTAPSLEEIAAVEAGQRTKL